MVATYEMPLCGPACSLGHRASLSDSVHTVLSDDFDPSNASTTTCRRKILDSEK